METRQFNYSVGSPNAAIANNDLWYYMAERKNKIKVSASDINLKAKTYWNKL